MYSGASAWIRCKAQKGVGGLNIYIYIYIYIYTYIYIYIYIYTPARAGGLRGNKSPTPVIYYTTLTTYIINTILTIL